MLPISAHLPVAWMGTFALGYAGGSASFLPPEPPGPPDPPEVCEIPDPPVYTPALILFAEPSERTGS